MKTIFAIFFSILLGSCPNNNQENQETKMNSLYQGTLHGNGVGGFEKENLVIKSEKEWQAFLLKADASNQFTDLIDFSKNIIIAVIDSQKNTGGFSIEISKIKEEKSKLLITIESKGPKPTDMVTMVLTQPIHIVKIPKTKKDIVFVTE
ncbi:protease complex subunit PrcB family protein [uncultured Tenacibaculum sp.]|uniref:protease complex subunit PrcB family protein n=1 Tax=uncultured Tenacibaculum sp. TaxID=174713 RepID=UPI00262E7BEE|nr:protease complex subunit PrcB family protein [uncultured Tenacibaculum sp.]